MGYLCKYRFRRRWLVIDTVVYASMLHHMEMTSGTFASGKRQSHHWPGRLCGHQQLKVPTTRDATTARWSSRKFPSPATSPFHDPLSQPTLPVRTSPFLSRFVDQNPQKYSRPWPLKLQRLLWYAFTRRTGLESSSRTAQDFTKIYSTLGLGKGRAPVNGPFPSVFLYHFQRPLLHSKLFANDMPMLSVSTLSSRRSPRLLTLPITVQF